MIGSCRPSISILYLLGIVNSSVLNFYLQCLNPEKGEALAEIKKENLEKLHIEPGSISIQEKIAKMVTEIMSLKKKDLPSENVEQKLNATICKIYN